MEGLPFRGDFHGFRSSFELEAGKSGVEDENVLKDMLRQAVSTDLAFKMTSLENEPKTYKDWLMFPWEDIDHHHHLPLIIVTPMPWT